MRKVLTTIYYFFFPKSIYAVLYRFSFYVFPIIYCYFSFNISLVKLLLLYFFIEGLVCPTRNLINDLHDYKDDILRGKKWTRIVSENNKLFVKYFIVIKLIAIFIISIIINIYLFLCVFILIFIQILYDFIKNKRYILSLIVVAFGYCVRTISFYFVFGVNFNASVYIIEFGIFLFALYQLMEWRQSEAHYIFKNGLKSKPGDEFFLQTKIDKYLVLLFICICILLDIWYIKNNKLTYIIFIFHFCIQALLIILFFKIRKLRNAIKSIGINLVLFCLISNVKVDLCLILFVPILIINRKLYEGNNDYCEKK